MIPPAAGAGRRDSARCGNMYPSTWKGRCTDLYSIGSVMRLRPGGYAGYKKAHDELWPELAEVIAGAGVSMVIYRHGDLLFVHGVAPTEGDWHSVRGQVVDRWMEWMTDFLETDETGKSVVLALEQAFSFGIFRP